MPVNYPDYMHLNYPLVSPNGIEGDAIYRERILTVPNINGKIAKVQTLTPDVTVQEVTTYRIIERSTGQTVQAVTDANPTAQEASDAIRAAIAGNAILNGLVKLSGTTTVIATARKSGLGVIQIDFADNGSTPTNLVSVATTTPAADAGEIIMGRGLVVDPNGVYKHPTAALGSTNVFAGVAIFTHAEVETVPGRLYPAYPPDFPVNRMIKGRINVYSYTPVDPTQGVYIVYAAGDTNARFRSTADAGNASLISAGASWVKKTSAPGLAELDLNLPA